MEEIGNLFALTREAAGVSLKEVSEDLKVEEAMLINIEDGKSGAFSDVFKLKDYIYNYAKYLGLDAEKIIDTFNEYIFESTSKIPIKDIEKQIEKEKEDDKKEVISPYTKKEPAMSNGLYILMCILCLIALASAIFWSVKTITINNKSAETISYNK